MVVAERLQVLDPTVQAIPEDAVVAERPETLDGKVIGLLANGKINSEEILALTQEVLADRYEFAAVVARNKMNASRPCPEHIIDELCGAVRRGDYLVGRLRVLLIVQCARRNNSRKARRSHGCDMHGAVHIERQGDVEYRWDTGLPVRGAAASAGQPGRGAAA